MIDFKICLDMILRTLHGQDKMNYSEHYRNLLENKKSYVQHALALDGKVK